MVSVAGNGRLGALEERWARRQRSRPAVTAPAVDIAAPTWRGRLVYPVAVLVVIGAYAAWGNTAAAVAYAAFAIALYLVFLVLAWWLKRYVRPAPRDKNM